MNVRAAIPAPEGATLREDAIGLLRAIVRQAGWGGDERGLLTALPHMAPALDAAELVSTLENLGVPHAVLPARLERLAADDCPCLLIDARGAARAAFDARPGEALILEPGEAEPAWRPAPEGAGHVVRILPATEGGPPRVTALIDLLRGSRGVLASLLLASFFTNLMAFATPVLVMVIYDRAIPVGATDFLISLTGAMAMVLVADVALRVIRARALADLGVRVERGLGLALFRKLMAMPLGQVEKSGVHEQLSRLKQFESLRDVFTGPLFAAALDLPFTLLFFVAIFALSPVIGFMLAGVTCLYLIAALVVAPGRRRLNEAAAKSRAAHQKLLFEITVKQLAIQRLGAGPVWARRADRLAAIAAADARRAKTRAVIAQTIGQCLMMAAGVGVVGLGAAQALSGDLSFGGLIAVMALVWRYLAPIQALYAASGQIETFSRSRRQADRVLALPEEFSRGVATSRMKAFTGRIAAVNVTHRFDSALDPVLSGVSFSAEPGELVMICGHGGSGKSTLLSLIVKLYVPTAGSIQLDGIDYRQIAADELRNAISYDLQTPEFLHGTVRQNLQMAHPTVTDEEIWLWLERLRLAAEVRRLPEGLDTRLTEALLKRLSPAMVKGLSLARCLLRPANIYLFGEPCIGLDNAREQAFLDVVASLKGERTVLMVTNRPSHFELADRLVMLDRGRVAVNEKGATARRKVAALQAHLNGK